MCCKTRTVCIPVGFGRVGCKTSVVYDSLREGPTLGEILGQASDNPTATFKCTGRCREIDELPGVESHI